MLRCSKLLDKIHSPAGFFRRDQRDLQRFARTDQYRKIQLGAGPGQCTVTDRHLMSAHVPLDAGDRSILHMATGTEMHQGKYVVKAGAVVDQPADPVATLGAGSHPRRLTCRLRAAPPIAEQPPASRPWTVARWHPCDPLT